MNPKALIKAAEHFVRANSPAILTGLGVAGTVTTGYLAHQAGYKTGQKDARDDGQMDPWKLRVKFNWKTYIPPIATGAVTIGCIVFATRIGNRRTAAMTAAYSLSEKAFSEYKEKVAEKIGEKKEQGIRDEIAQEKVGGNAPAREMVILGTGNHLCCELRTGRYFLSDMESLRRAQNEVNDRLIKHRYVTLAEFYRLLNVYIPNEAANWGWDYDSGDTPEKSLMELKFSTVLADESRPCLAFDFNYLDAL